MSDNPSQNKNSQGLKVAAMVQSGKGQTAAIERAPGIYESRGIGNSYLITTNEGDVLINAGALNDARRGRELFAEVSSQSIRFIILTQSHANQYGGLEVYKTEQNQVIAHRIYPEDRQYNKALEQHYLRVSQRIFGGMTGAKQDVVPTREVEPDILIDDFYAFELGGRRFELIWTPGGETRSALIVWLPQEKIAIVGNLFGPLFGNHPNLNTLRGDKPRSALEFIDSAKTVRKLRPEQILTGHEDIRGAAHIQQELSRVIDSMQWVLDRTFEGMNQGKDLNTLMREIKTPPELTLTEEYGKLTWNVRTIWHEYSGWFDPSRGINELYPVPLASVAPALVELTAGTEKLVDKAREFIQQHQPLEALHLLEIALAAEPDCSTAKDAKCEALGLLLQQTGGQNLWERMWISTEIQETRS